MNFKMLFKNRISLLVQGVGGRENGKKNERGTEMGRNDFQRPHLALPHFGENRHICEIWPVLMAFT